MKVEAFPDRYPVFKTLFHDAALFSRLPIARRKIQLRVEMILVVSNDAIFQLSRFPNNDLD
jgi:hypothetical protein